MIKKTSAVMLAIIVGIVSAVVTYIVMGSTFEARMEGSDEQLSLREFVTVEDYIEKYYLCDRI